MGSVMQWLFLTAIIGVALGNVRSPSAEPSDITSINNLKDRNGIATMILRVLQKIRESGSLPHDFPHADYLRLLSAHQAESEDLGSLELSGELTKAGEFKGKNDAEFGKKLTDSKGEGAKEAQKNVETSNFEKYYISPTNSEENSSSQNHTYNTPEVSTETAPTSSVTLEDAYSQTKTESKEELQPEETSESMETTTVMSEVQTYSNHQPHNDEFNGYRYEVAQNVQDSEKSGNTAITQYMSSENEYYSSREERKNNAGENYYQVETPQGTESHIKENQPDANLVSDEFTNDEEKKFSEQYEYMPSAMETNLVPTKPTPGKEIVVMGPTPIDIPDAQYEEDESSTPTHISLNNVSPQSHEERNEENKNKYENVRHSVEFAPSPLVAAFTVQQDDKGIPRKIVPLDYDHPTLPPTPTENPEIIAQRQRELEEQEFILYQQLKSLQEEKYKYISPQQRQQQLQRLQRQEELNQQQLQQHRELQRQEELKRQQVSYTNQNYYHQNYQHSPEYSQKEQLRHEGYVGQVEYVPYQDVQRQKQQLYRNNLHPYQDIEFHKSVDYSLPQHEHNRVHRREPSNYIGNHGHNKPFSVSGQIQNLITSAGITSGLPSNTKTDFNLVSKILALNHGVIDGTAHPVFRRSHGYVSY